LEFPPLELLVEEGAGEEEEGEEVGSTYLALTQPVPLL